MEKKKQDRAGNGWWGSFLPTIVATTLSIVLTFGTARVMEWRQRVNDRKLSAMMVMSSLESFVRQLEEREKEMARTDTVACWLLRLPEEELDRYREEKLIGYLQSGLAVSLLVHDSSAERIFSSNMDTWKNLGNPLFIDNVGTCFSLVNQIEKDWNDWAYSMAEEFKRVINEAIDKQKGKGVAAYILRDIPFRQELARIHARCDWLRYMAETCRNENRYNMALIGIPEEEVKAFTDQLSQKDSMKGKDPEFTDYDTPVIPLDSLTTMPTPEALMQ